jgi:uncharacterized protein (TIGR02452 family)
MTPPVHQIPRDLARQYGEEAVAIIDSGGYIAPSGKRVELKDAVDRAVQGTRSYPPGTDPAAPAPGAHATAFEVANETTLAAALRQRQLGHRPVVLNFASATSPGGGFLTGSRAQEEYLARSSGLYACLRENDMYAFHRKDYNALYTDYVLYSPDVPVFRADDGTLLEEPYTVAMLTSPAVNANRVPAEDHGKIAPAMASRIPKVLAAGAAHSHDAIVLGAWGCGAFGNDGPTIARLFHEALTGPFRGIYRHVAFAVIDTSEERRFIGPFEAVFGR